MNVTRLRLTEPLLNDDISLFVDYQVETKQLERNITINQDLLNRIKSTLKSKSEKMSVSLKNLIVHTRPKLTSPQVLVG